ncbi:MAG: ATP synthase F1 subunit epsilon [Candidatus Binataceae bacterium]|nr:ATP synthase F1 subunit epsilon [Candidatus Binataceae bacterium]
MATEFPLRLVTPTGVVFDGTVQQVDAVNPLGEFGVLADHVDYITALVPGLLTITLPDGTHHFYLVSGGIAEVRQGAMTVLADDVGLPAPADEAALSSAAQSALEKLAGLSLYDAGYPEAADEIAVFRARIRASQLAREQGRQA